MQVLFMILFFFVAFFLISLILLQEGKGGGLAAMGGGAMDSVMGARNPLRMWTVYFAIAFVVLTLGINYSVAQSGSLPDPVDTVPSPPAPSTDMIIDAPPAEGEEPTDSGMPEIPGTPGEIGATDGDAPVEPDNDTDADAPDAPEGDGGEAPTPPDADDDNAGANAEPTETQEEPEE